jgi:hypothetical protein
VLTAPAGSAASPTLSGTLAGAPNTAYLIEFFASQGPSPSGYGEGQKLLLDAEVATDGSGYLASSSDKSAVISNPGTANAGFAVSLPPLSAGQDYLSATATNLATDDTSGFSRDGVAATLTVTPSTAIATYGQATFTATISPATGTPSLSGSVDFVDATTNTDLGTAPVIGNAARITVAPPGVGQHVIEAVYAGVTSAGSPLVVGPSAVAPAVTITPATPTVTVSDGSSDYIGLPFFAYASVAGVVAGVDSTPAGSLEGVAPTVTYYHGSYSTVAALQAANPAALPRAPFCPAPTPPWPPSPAAAITRAPAQ